MHTFPQKWLVLGGALLVTIVAYLAVGMAPGILAPAPLLPTLLFLAMYPIAGEGGPLTFILFFVPIFFAICLVLSAGLLFKIRRAWEVSAALYSVTAVANIVYFIVAWSHGMDWQGLPYTLYVLGLNIGFAILTAYLLLKSRRQPTEPNLFLKAHVSILLWVGWVSFPWLGEWL